MARTLVFWQLKRFLEIVRLEAVSPCDEGEKEEAMEMEMQRGQIITSYLDSQKGGP